LHLHLTEDQGWRIEIKKYPKLTRIGSVRGGTLIGKYPGKGNTNAAYGGFYTQAQLKDLVAYAAAKHINIIPEIEIPGHASAAIAAYPELSCFPNEPTQLTKNMYAAATENKIKKVSKTQISKNPQGKIITKPEIAAIGQNLPSFSNDNLSMKSK
jgi:hexosaminidase